MCTASEFKDIINTRDSCLRHNDKTNLVYQYRNFDLFWKIIKNEEMWVTNIRFFNDSQEVLFGEKLLNKLYNTSVNNIKKSDYYVMCFCKENDILSQWRGYAPNGGVSIGFDFHTPVPFSIKNIYDSNNNYTKFADTSYVHYIEPISNNIQDDLLKEKKKNLEQTTGIRADDIEHNIKALTKYMKHKGFEEEKELRIIFNNENNSIKDSIDYREDPSDTRKLIPYIKINAGSTKYEQNDCSVRLQHNSSKIIFSDLTMKLAKHTASVYTCKKENGSKDDNILDDSKCFGCTSRHFFNSGFIECKYNTNSANYAFGYNKENECIYISQGKNQEEVFYIIYDYIKKLDLLDEIKIWCEGHFPIRSVKIGPCENQDEIYESILHYFNQKYWLKFVDITTSNIPYKQPRL